MVTIECVKNKSRAINARHSFDNSRLPPGSLPARPPLDGGTRPAVICWFSGCAHSHNLSSFALADGHHLDGVVLALAPSLAISGAVAVGLRQQFTGGRRLVLPRGHIAVGHSESLRMMFVWRNDGCLPTRQSVNRTMRSMNQMSPNRNDIARPHMH